MVFATNGVITKISDYGNSDKLLSMITPTGRIAVMVKGAKSPTSKLMAISQLFTYGNYEIYEKNNSYWLRGGSVINSFYEITRDISSLSLATYLCELANEFTDEGIEDDEIMRLLLNSLHLICQNKKPRELIKGVFEFRAMCQAGYMPELAACIYCGEFEAEYNYLDVSGGRVVCADCLNKRNKKIPKISKEFDYNDYKGAMCPVSSSVLASLRYIERAQSSRVFSFELKDTESLNEFSKVCETYLLEHLGRGFDSLDFYKSVK